MDSRSPNIIWSWNAIFSLCFLCLQLSIATEAMNGTNSAATNVLPDRFPNPWHDPEKCQRTISETSWICDIDGVLTIAEADAINRHLTSINANASCVCNCSSSSAYVYDDSIERGYVIAAIAVKTLGEGALPVANQSYNIEQFSNSVRQDWFSNRTCEDSALVLAHYMYNCSKIHISVGDALRNLLPDLSLIYNAAQPNLRTGNIGQALQVTVQKLSTALEKAIDAPTNNPPDNLAWGILGVITVSSILLFHYWIKY